MSPITPPPTVRLHGPLQGPGSLFMSNRTGNSDTYAMGADGSDPVNVTNHAAEDGFPSWSPDSRRIAFTSNRDGNTEIYVMNADGS